jgi:hypothetical protein
MNYRLFQYPLRIQGSAPAPGAVFRALAENLVTTESFGGCVSIRSSEMLDARARPATPGAGVLPWRFHGSGLNTL